MKYRILIVVAILCLSACTKIDNETVGMETSGQTETQTEAAEAAITESEITETSVTETKEMHEFIEQIGTVPDMVEVEAEAFPFSDMQYVALIVKEEPQSEDDTSLIPREYTLIGGKWASYETGREGYETVNLLFADKLSNSDNEKPESNTELTTEQLNRPEALGLHIVCFSSDGKRVLLKDYRNWSGSNVPYEVYENLTPAGTYKYNDVLDLYSVNYTKGLKFVNTDLGGNTSFVYGNAGNGDLRDFYHPSQLSSQYDDNGISDADLYWLTRTTNPSDTIYYKQDSDEEGNKCIGIYSVGDNKLLYQSQATEYGIDIGKNLQTVDLLDDKIIAGVYSSVANNSKFEKEDRGYRTFKLLDYYEIDINNGEWTYLFTDELGKFSPDGKFFVNYFVDSRIVCLETGQYTTVINKVKRDIGYTRYSTICWVSKDKIDELLELAAQ